MAITFLNQTLCNICGNVLAENEDIFSFPPFLQNTDDKLYKYNDSSFHSNCLLKSQSGLKAIQLTEKFLFETRPENRICDITKDVIRNYSNYFFIDILTSDEQQSLYKYNLTTLDVKNIKLWNHKDEFVSEANIFKNKGLWKDIGTFKYLDSLIEIIVLNR